MHLWFEQTRPPVQPVHAGEGFDQPVLQPPPHQIPMPMQAEQRREVRLAVGGGSVVDPVLPMARFPERTVSRDQIEGLDIPTFIRRQMD